MHLLTTSSSTTKDDFGTDGDDTPHTGIPDYPLPVYQEVKVGLPSDGSSPAVADLVFIDFFADKLVEALNTLGGKYTKNDYKPYMPAGYTTNNYLVDYVKTHWQANIANCPVGQGVGYPDN